MTISDALSVVNATKWGEEGFYLKEFLHKNHLPKVVKVIKGQYLNLGAPSIGSPSLQQHLLLVNLGKRKRVMAQCVRFKDGHRKLVPVGQKLAIPVNYDGHFEILSEDGRCVKCIESVAELCIRFPESVLVRENVRAFVSKSDDVETIKDKSRIINEGETLILVGEVMGAKAKGRFLRCLDNHGDNIYLPHELRCKFSAIAKEDNISGVHSVGNLMNKRLPMMVRLVHGKPPRHLKSLQNFSAEMRILTEIEEDFIVALTLSKDSSLVPIPQAALIKVQTATNPDELAVMPEMSRLVEQCREMAQDFMDEMTIHDIAFSRDLRLNGTKGLLQQPGPVTNTRRRIRRSGLIRSPPDSAAATGTATTGGSGRNKDDYDEIEQIYDYVRGFAPLPRSAKGWRYEGHGSANSSPKHEIHHRPEATSTPSRTTPPGPEPPEPPPIETIPTTRPTRPASMEISSPPASPVVLTGAWEHHHHLHHYSLEANKENKKRQRSRMASDSLYPSGFSRFVKSASQSKASSGQKPRFFRYRGGKGDLMQRMNQSLTLSRSNLYSAVDAAKTPPSFFHLRYKSLTNLAYGSSAYNVAEYDTLDSSNSGAKTTSGDSGGSRALPEKRSRKQLSRPKSLTNLVFGNTTTSSSHYSSMTNSNEAASGTISRASTLQRPQTRSSHPQPRTYHSNKLGTASGSSSKRLGTLYL